MGFELTVVSNTPLTGVSDPDQVAVEFFRLVGYLPPGDRGTASESVPYRLLVDCFQHRPDKAWTVEELITTLGTSRPTVYRHLNKLKGLDLLEESLVRHEGDAPASGRKAYRIRYGNLGKAWNFVEANVNVAMENYRKTVDHLQGLLQREVKP